MQRFLCDDMHRKPHTPNDMKKIFYCLFFLLLSLGIGAQDSLILVSNHDLSVAERNAEQGFNDTIDRLAEDFVQVSLCIADPTDWREDALGTAGHAFLRLQCPTFGLDYCFSYEGERVNDNIFRYANGQTKMGMFAVPTNDYLEDYRQWNRSVHEYVLAMPPESEQRLWEIMDNHLTKGLVLRQDLNKYGCAITVVRYIKQALKDVPIVYAPDDELNGMTRREIGYRSLANHPWLRVTSMIFTDNRADKELPIDEKLIIPADLATVWQQATIQGQPMATYVGDIVEGAPVEADQPWFTPIVLAWLIVLITLALAFTRYPYWDWFLLVCQALSGCLLIFLWIIMAEFGNAAFILMALLNPLPLLLWRWRTYWALPYAIGLTIGIIVLLCLPHMLIDPAFIVLAVAYIILFAKDSVKRLLKVRR